VASRKEQKAALRRQREERERAAREAERRKRLVGYGAAGGLVAAAVIALVVVLLVSGGGGGQAKADVFPSGGHVPKARTTDLKPAAGAAGCTLRSRVVRASELNPRHITDLNKKVPYPFNPPAAGQHYVQPAQDGLYAKAPPDTTLVHSQEHGRVVIWVQPSLPKAERADLRALFDKNNGYQLLMVPRTRMPFAVAATAWIRDPDPTGTGRLLGCTRVSDRTFDALQAFIDENRGNGPEAVP
jgi:hypothetical protein